MTALAPFTDDYYRAFAAELGALCLKYGVNLGAWDTSDAYLSNPVLVVTAPLASSRPDSEFEVTSDKFPEIVG